MFFAIINLFRISVLLLTSGVFYRLIPFLLLQKDELVLRNRKIKLAKSIKKALESMGPSFVKLGQFLSTRPDVLGDDVVSILASMQDKMPPFPFKFITSTIEGELNSSVKDLFREISPEPIAAASIAQVHKAITMDGKVVAVKVLRPGIEQQLAKDLALFFMVARFLHFSFPSLRRLHLREVVAVLKSSVNIEMDLRMEAAAADQLSINMETEPCIYIPKIYWSLTAKRVLTMEWIDGIHPTNIKKLHELKINMYDLTKNLAISFFNQAFRDGFFHADLHPGNMMIMPDGKIALIDFGIMGYLNKRDKIFIAEMLHSFMDRDYDKVADLHFKAGYIAKNQSREYFALACRSIGEPIIGMQANKISVGYLLKQLMSISRDFDMQLQPQLVLMQKTLVTIEGLGVMFYPEVNMWELAEPWIAGWAKSNFGIKAKIGNSYRGVIDVLQHLNDMAGIDEKGAKPIMENVNPNKYLYLFLGAALGAIASFAAMLLVA